MPTTQSTPPRPPRDDRDNPRTEAGMPVVDLKPSGTSASAPLFPGVIGAELEGRWRDVQAMFVDDPRRAVTEADALLSHALDELVAVFKRERQSLEDQWSRGESVSTEDLRVVIQRYREFFHRLLAF